MLNPIDKMDACPIQILGTGRALPRQSVSSAELDEQLGFSSGKIFKAGGVQTRYFAIRQLLAEGKLVATDEIRVINL